VSEEEAGGGENVQGGSEDSSTFLICGISRFSHLFGYFFFLQFLMFEQ